METIQIEHFTKALLLLLDETFDHVHGFFLDKNNSFFETLATISAQEASRPVGKTCATLAAQVKHTAFYLHVIDRSVRESNFPQVDWNTIWETTGQVTEDEWQAIQNDLRTNYDRIKTLINESPAWSSEAQIGGAIAVVAHTAYHLGEIRQALCFLRE